MRRFQIRLSDAVLMACVPAISAVAVNGMGVQRHSPGVVYLIAMLVVTPGAILGLMAVNHEGHAGLRRMGLLASYMIASAVVGFIGAAPVEAEWRRRQMANNQVSAAAACKTFAEAEELYRRNDFDGDGILEYAQTLHELAAPGGGKTPLILQEFADAEGLPGVATPRQGYVFKVLTAQGPNATGGSRNYIANGNMTLGYALLACPAEYDETGRDSFVISNNGTIFQTDYGPSTPTIMQSTNAFNPDPYNGAE